MFLTPRNNIEFNVNKENLFNGKPICGDPIFTGMNPDYTKTDIAISFPAGGQRSRVNQRVDLKNDILTIRCRLAPSL